MGRLSPPQSERDYVRTVGQDFEELIGMKKLSLDWWSVLIGLGATALVRFGFLPHIPW